MWQYFFFYHRWDKSLLLQNQLVFFSWLNQFKDQMLSEIFFHSDAIARFYLFNKFCVSPQDNLCVGKHSYLCNMYLILIDEIIFYTFLSFSRQVKSPYLKFHIWNFIEAPFFWLPQKYYSITTSLRQYSHWTAELQLWNATRKTKTSAYTFQVSAGFGFSVKCLATDFCLIQIHNWVFGWWTDCKPL